MRSVLDVKRTFWHCQRPGHCYRGRALSESTLATLVLNLAIQFAQPGASPYSLKPMPECGIDRLAPTCPIEPVCDDPKLACRPPYWSRGRNAWVRMESSGEAKQRYEVIASSLASTAERLTSCAGDASCGPSPWQGTAAQLAMAALTVVLHESG